MSSVMQPNGLYAFLAPKNDKEADCAIRQCRKRVNKHPSASTDPSIQAQLPNDQVVLGWLAKARDRVGDEWWLKPQEVLDAVVHVALEQPSGPESADVKPENGKNDASRGLDDEEEEEQTSPKPSSCNDTTLDKPTSPSHDPDVDEKQNPSVPHHAAPGSVKPDSQPISLDEKEDDTCTCSSTSMEDVTPDKNTSSWHDPLPAKKLSKPSSVPAPSDEETAKQEARNDATSGKLGDDTPMHTCWNDLIVPKEDCRQPSAAKMAPKKLLLERIRQANVTPFDPVSPRPSLPLSSTTMLPLPCPSSSCPPTRVLPHVGQEKSQESDSSSCLQKNEAGTEPEDNGSDTSNDAHMRESSQDESGDALLPPKTESKGATDMPKRTESTSPPLSPNRCTSSLSKRKAEEMLADYFPHAVGILTQAKDLANDGKPNQALYLLQSKGMMARTCPALPTVQEWLGTRPLSSIRMPEIDRVICKMQHASVERLAVLDMGRALERTLVVVIFASDKYEEDSIRDMSLNSMIRIVHKLGRPVSQFTVEHLDWLREIRNAFLHDDLDCPSEKEEPQLSDHNTTLDFVVERVGYVLQDMKTLYQCIKDDKYAKRLRNKVSKLEQQAAKAKKSINPPVTEAPSSSTPGPKNKKQRVHYKT